MAQPPDWKRALETGMQFTEMRRSQAYRIAADLVAQGQLARDQIGAAVDELVEMSRRRSEELRAVVSSEVQRQLGAIGFATKRDLELLERRLRGTAGSAAAKKTAGAKATAATRGPAKKRAATKTPAKTRTTAKKAASKKPPTKKTTAKKRTAKQAVRRQTVTKRTPVRKAARKPAARRAR